MNAYMFRAHADPKGCLCQFSNCSAFFATQFLWQQQKGQQSCKTFSVAIVLYKILCMYVVVTSMHRQLHKYI